VTLVERAAAEEEEAREEEEPAGDLTALCGEGGSVLRMLRTIDSDHDRTIYMIKQQRMH
jgi:hypothetical protein